MTASAKDEYDFAETMGGTIVPAVALLSASALVYSEESIDE
jgi:hypothetical protein